MESSTQSAEQIEPEKVFPPHPARDGSPMRCNQTAAVFVLETFGELPSFTIPTFSG
jgi:hypothetical protein